MTVVVADDTKKVDINATCTGLTIGGGAVTSGTNPLIDTLTGCTVPSADNGDTFTSNDNVSLPGGAYESAATLAKTGEGSTNQDKNLQEQRRSHGPAGRLYHRRDQLLFRRTRQQRRDQWSKCRLDPLHGYQQPNSFCRSTRRA